MDVFTHSGRNEKSRVNLYTHLKKYGINHFPIDTTINMLGRKFTLHILRNMMLLKQKRFSELMNSIEGINTKTLSIRLKELEKEDLVNKTVVSRSPVQTEYYVSEKGLTIEPILELLAEFSMKYEPKLASQDK